MWIYVMWFVQHGPIKSCWRMMYRVLWAIRLGQVHSLQCIDASNFKHLWHETSILWSASSAGSKGCMFAVLVPLRGCTPSNLWNGDDGLQGSWTLDRVALMSSVSLVPFKSASRCNCCCMHVQVESRWGGLDWKAATSQNNPSRVCI